VTKSDSDDSNDLNLKSSFFYGDNIDYSGSCGKPGDYKEPSIYILGTMVRGYMKEASIWSRAFDKEQVSQLKYLYI
jgi:hypothetical protein